MTLTAACRTTVLLLASECIKNGEKRREAMDEKKEKKLSRRRW